MPTDNPRPTLFEFGTVPRQFCTELARIERMGPCVMLVWAVEQQQALEGSPGPTERLIESRLIIPADRLPAVVAMIQQWQAATGDVGAAGEMLAGLARPAVVN
jgi:hypothetical protein